MRNLVIAISLLIGLSSCKSCTSTYSSRKAGVQRVCPNCIYINSESMSIAVDTSVQPNIIYKVGFKSGGIYYTASDVDYLIKIQ
jgi:hypothetical protein